MIEKRLVPKTTDDKYGGIEPISDAPPLGIRVHRQLEDQIITGALPPGVRLVEEELARTMGVSRGPVRTALHQLAVDGFVDLRPRLGAFVHNPTLKEVDDFYAIRRVLEGESARLAATRITPQWAEQLQDCVDLARFELKRNRDPANKVVSLHGLICTIADNNELNQYLSLHRKRSVWYRTPFDAGQRRKTWDEHARIVKLIISGDAPNAAKAMQAHIDSARIRNRRS